MSRKIPERVRERIKQLYLEEGLSPTEILRRVKGVSYTFVYGLTVVSDRGFESLTTYREHLAKEKGYGSLNEYNKKFKKKKPKIERKFIKDTDPTKQPNAIYMARTLKRLGISRREYDRKLAKKRKTLPRNKALSKLIRDGLDRIGENQNWLAEVTEYSKQAISLYARGEEFPTEERLIKILLMLGVNKIPRSLDDII